MLKTIAMRDHLPLVTLEVVFHTGSAQDPVGQGGAAWMTAAMLANGGSRTLTYKQILDSLFPMGVTVATQVDKEMVSFSAEVHIDHLEQFYAIFRSMLLDPGWRQGDFERLRDDAVNYLVVGLRGQNDEELAKDVLCSRVFVGHPYERHNTGSVTSLRALTVSQLRAFYLAQFAQNNLTVAIGGGFPPGFEDRIRRDFSVLPLRARIQAALPPAPPIAATELYMVEKATRGVAMSLGFPIDVTRGHPDYLALLVASSALGQHRMSSGRLFTRMRQLRGLNYGDYSYIEHFPGGMYTLEAQPNVARSRQIFHLWVRPVDRGLAHFALRLALHELERFVRDGLAQQEFERARSFLSKYVNLLLKTKAAELGYAVDSAFYGIGPYPEYVRAGLRDLTAGALNAALRRHLRWERLKIVLVGEGMAELRDRILTNAESPMTYNSPKSDEILKEDEVVMRREIRVMPQHALVVGVDETFE